MAKSAIDLLQDELNNFKSERDKSQTKLSEELAKAKSDYEEKVSEIEAKYPVDDLNEKIKRHEFLIKFANGDIAFPDEKPKTVGNEAKTAKKNISDMQGKISKAVEKLGGDVSKIKLPELVGKLQELFSEYTFISNNVNSSFNTYKKKLQAK